MKELIAQMYAIISAPFLSDEIFWAAFPLITTAIMFELYFGSHKEESLGWNSATANGLVIVYVAISTLRYLVSSNLYDLLDIRSQIAIVILVLGVALVIVSFFHVLPQEVAFFISSGLVVHYIALLGLLFVYTDFIFSNFTAYAAFVLFICFVVFFKIVKHFEPDIN